MLAIGCVPTSALPIPFTPSEDQGYVSDAAGELVNRRAFALGIEQFLQGHAPSAAFDGAAGDKGHTEAVEAKPGILHHAAGHVHHEAALELPIEDGGRGG